jgi:LacI family transcriptional regulator
LPDRRLERPAERTETDGSLQGHTRIGMLKGSALAVDAAERYGGFRQALEAHGLEFDPSICGEANFCVAEGFTEMQRILRVPHPPTAMFCANDLMAIGASQGAQAQGLNVPDDLSVIGSDGIEAALYHHPPITTLQPPLLEIGRRAVELLISRIEHPADHREQIPFHATLIVRQSTGPYRPQDRRHDPPARRD